MLCSAAMSELENELRSLIKDSLELEDVTPESIDASAPLFGDGEGLGLDSIDALELAVAISKKYDVTLKADDEDTKNAFASLSSLAEYISKNRPAA